MRPACAARRPRRHQRRRRAQAGAPRRVRGRSAGATRGSSATTSSVSVAHRRAHGVDEHAAGPHQRRDAGEQLALQRREPWQIVLGRRRQRSSGWRRSVPRPEHGASTRTASNGRAAVRAGRRPRRRATSAIPRRAASAAIRRTPPRCTSSATTRPAARRGAACGVLPPGAAHASSTRIARARHREARSRAARPRPGTRSDRARNAGSARSRAGAARRAPAHRRAQRAGAARTPLLVQLARRAPRASCGADSRARVTGPLVVVRRQQRRQLVDADLVGEALDQPARVRPLDGEPVERDRPWHRAGRRARVPRARHVAGPRSRGRPRRARGRCASRTLASTAAYAGTRSRNSELVEPEPERRPHRRVERGERPAHEPRPGDGRAGPATRACRRRARVASARSARRRRRRRRAPSSTSANAAVRLDAHEHVVRDGARVAPGRHPPRHVPGGEAVAGEERRRIEPPLALELHLEQPQRAVARRDDDAAWRRGDHRARRRRVGACGRERRAVHLQRSCRRAW